VRAEYQGQHT